MKAKYILLPTLPSLVALFGLTVAILLDSIVLTTLSIALGVSIAILMFYMFTHKE